MSRDMLDTGIASRFENIVASHPDHIALQVDDRAITYAEFNLAANRIARLLVERLGSDPAPVALLFGSGAHFYIAMLAVLKAGKFYVPLDPMHPKARLSAIVVAAEPQVTLTEARYATLATELIGDQGWIDVESAALPDSAENLALPISGDALLNVMFTSGSTGRPKGVIQRQRNILHTIAVGDAMLQHSADDRFAQLMSPSFGASVANTLGAFLQGATLLPFGVKRHGIDALSNWLRQEHITVYHSVPTVFRQLLLTLLPDDTFPAMRAIKLGGEPIYKRDIDGFKRHFLPGTLLRTGLGSTEGYLVTYKLIDHDTIIETPLVSLGIVSPDMTIELLDENEAPVPTGKSGEIAVRSRYLSPGYWRDPEATAAAFRTIPDSAERIYFTGDLGRWLPDGELEHLSRKDAQVKIRGNRVETAEIEVALLELDNVREATVIALERIPGEMALAAYIVPAQRPAPNSAELRAHLIARLPPFMIPAAFVILDALPLLPFGKVNRKALPGPQWEAAAAYVAPETPLQQQIAAIWATLLDIEHVGLDDDFFALGGDSLRGGQVIARLRTDCGLDIGETALFEAPTLRQLADYTLQHQLEQLSAEEIDSMLTDLEGLSDDEIAQLLATDNT